VEKNLSQICRRPGVTTTLSLTMRRDFDGVADMVSAAEKPVFRRKL